MQKDLRRQLKKTHRPLVSTQNGKPAAVMLRSEDFDVLVERQRFVVSVVTASCEGRIYSDEVEPWFLKNFRELRR